MTSANYCKLSSYLQLLVLYSYDSLNVSCAVQKFIFSVIAYVASTEIESFVFTSMIATVHKFYIYKENWTLLMDDNLVCVATDMVHFQLL